MFARWADAWTLHLELTKISFRLWGYVLCFVSDTLVCGVGEKLVEDTSVKVLCNDRGQSSQRDRTVFTCRRYIYPKCLTNEDSHTGATPGSVSQSRTLQRVEELDN